jgi:flagellar biosynthetic protein FliR
MLIEPILAKVLLIGARVGMLMVFAPFLGSQAISRRVKAGLTLALTVLLYPAYIGNPGSLLAGNWFALFFGELIVGLLIGLSMQVVFESVLMAGEIMGFQLGFTLENVIDPTTQVEIPVLSTFSQSISLLIFLQLNAHYWVLRALAYSFEILPPGKVNAAPRAAASLLNAAGGIFWVGVQMAAPILVVTFLTDVALSYVSRAATQFPVIFAGISIKDLLGMAVLGVCIGFWPGILGHDFHEAARLMEHLFALCR